MKEYFNCLSNLLVDLYPAIIVRLYLVNGLLGMDFFGYGFLLTYSEKRRYILIKEVINFNSNGYGL